MTFFKHIVVVWFLAVSLVGFGQGALAQEGSFALRSGDTPQRLKQRCKDGYFIAGGRVTCIKISAAPQASQGIGGLAAPGRVSELSWCCKTCTTTGVGQNCHQQSSSTACMGAQNANCFVNCANGETNNGGTVTCH